MCLKVNHNSQSFCPNRYLFQNSKSVNPLPRVSMELPRQLKTEEEEKAATIHRQTAWLHQHTPT